MAAGLAARGARVLLADTDGQGNVGASLALSYERSLYHVLVMGLPIEDAVVQVMTVAGALMVQNRVAEGAMLDRGHERQPEVLVATAGAGRPHAPPDGDDVGPGRGDQL